MREVRGSESEADEWGDAGGEGFVVLVAVGLGDVEGEEE